MQTTRRARPAVLATLALGAAALALPACSRNTETVEEGAQPAPAQPSETAPSGAGNLPPGHPPVGGMPGGGGQEIVPPSPDAGRGEAGMTWSPPANWTVEPPSSAMRRAQYRVPASSGQGDGECVVFYFGPNEGGDVQANVQRWAGQFPREDNSPAPVRSSEITVGAIPVTLVEIEGTFAGGMGSTVDEPKAGYMLLGAVAKGPDANWFFKCTGPKATMEAQRDEFDGMIKSLRAGA